MSNYISSAFCFFLCISVLYSQGRIGEQLDSLNLSKSIESVLGKNAVVNWHQIIIEEDQKEAIEPLLKVLTGVPDSLNFAKIKLDQEVFYLILDEAPGKTEKFTYALYTNEDFSIKDVDVLVYRELYGGEIDESAFRQQFTGIHKPQHIIFGRSIQGITGATISSRSITYHVRDILLIFTTVMGSQ